MDLKPNSSNWFEGQTCTIEDKLLEKGKQIADLLGYDVCLSFMFNEPKNIAVLKSKYFKYDNMLQFSIPKVIFINRGNNSLLKKVIDSKTLIENNNNLTLIEGMQSEICIPIFEYSSLNEVSENIIGCLYLGSIAKNEFPFEEIYELPLNDIVSDISKLCTLDLMEYRNSVYMIYLTCNFMVLLGHKEVYLPLHSYNVASWCTEIGMDLGLSSYELHRLTCAGLLHDIGKLMIDFDILNKPDSLDEEEYEIVKKHPLYSYEMLKNVFNDSDLSSEIPYIIKYHHERYDGQGYPDGLKENEVPIESYIIGICDAVDAMLSERPYKEPLPLNNVITELYRNKGKQFHPELVDIMVEKLGTIRRDNLKKLKGVVDIGSLIISINNKLKIIEGNFINMKNYYIFVPLDEMSTKGIELSKVTNAEVVIKNLNNLNYYKVKLEDFVNNMFFISDVLPIPIENSFSLYWKLKGVLHKSDGTVLIEIVRVGGSSLDFYIHNSVETNSISNKPLIIDILFDDGNVDITGQVVRSYNFGPLIYCELRYTNIPDSKRDYIYRQLFKEQIQLRKTIAKYK